MSDSPEVDEARKNLEQFEKGCTAKRQILRDRLNAALRKSRQDKN